MSQKTLTDQIHYKKLFLGILIFILVIIIFRFNQIDRNISFTAAIAAIMACLWITEAIPIGVTSLLPLVLFPAFGILDGKTIANSYINYIIFLFIGGFIMALSIEKWKLHKRIALKILSMAGSSPFRILTGFMFASWILSMWISNTATAMMMLPIALSVSHQLEKQYEPESFKKLNVGILLGIAYSCSIGGIATLVGTPPNLSFVRILSIIFPQAPEISFGSWLIFALPLSLIMFLSALLLLYVLYKPKKINKAIGADYFRKEYQKLGAFTLEEKRVLILFMLLVFLWIFRKPIHIGHFHLPGWSQLFPDATYINDGTVAVFIAILLFIIPSGTKNKALADWNIVSKIPWQIVFLFGGGFALAYAFVESGLSGFIGEQLSFASSSPTAILLAVLTSVMTLLTEFTSNTATTEMMLPIVAGLATSIHIHPLLLMLPMTLAASMAFMVPVATPPNAIIFGSKKIKMMQMLKTGFLLNLLAIIFICLFMLFWADIALSVDLDSFPGWGNV
jgi:sodium-dependent dicarboxylate transporter 2/3/5